MGKTTIDWATDVWNPVTGCQKVSQGCKNCYAERIASRFWGERKFTDVICHEDRLEIPLHWNKPRRVFVNSMSDLFHPAVPFEFIKRAFQVMTQAEQHTFMVLTKRPERMVQYFKWDGFGGDNPYAWPGWIWLGVSVEDQAAADDRIPLLLQTPAKVKFISAEPLLGPIDFDLFNQEILEYEDNHAMFWHSKKCDGYCDYACGGDFYKGSINWVICGGESGPEARPMHPDWTRSIRDQCQQAAVPFFFKQWGEWLHRSQVDSTMQGNLAMANVFGKDFQYHHWQDGSVSIRVGKKAAGHLIDGKEWREFPT